MFLLLVAFFSGILTVLSPCVLPLLPIILGTSVGESKSMRAPILVIASLSFSVFIFSLLLKVSTLLIDVSPEVWKIFSGAILIFLGCITLFPKIWDSISSKIGLHKKSHNLLHAHGSKSGTLKYLGVGFALGPVFSSCSPTYALILAIILPASLIGGLAALFAYIVGLAAVLLLIAFAGQTIIRKMLWASAANGTFKRILGILFIIIGLMIVSGFDKKIEAKMLDLGFLNTTNFEQNIIDSIEIESFSDEVSHNNDDMQLSFLEKKDTNTCSGGACENEQFSENTGSMIGQLAPEFTDITNWINSPEITSIHDLQGKVIMIDFWTLGCANCIATHDQTQELYETYKDEGFVVIGLHAPEFSYERNIELVEDAVKEYQITFPVAQDNEFSTWRKYKNRYWPAFYIIDKNGVIRETHFGEGGKDKKIETIEKLLQESA